MMKDFRYVIKKILIGIGIIIGVSMIRSCKVSAYNGNVLESTKSFITSNSNYVLLNSNSYRAVYQNINDGSFAFTNTSSKAWIIKSEYENGDSFYYNRVGIQANPNSDTVSTKIFLTQDVQLPRASSPSANYYSSYGPTLVISISGAPYATNLSPYTEYFSSSGTNNIYAGTSALQNLNFYSNVQWNYYGSNTVNSNINIEPLQPAVPEIVSLNPVLNKTEDNMLVSVSFTLEFSFVDTENYNYSAWFDGYDKLSITENNVKLNTQSNTTLFVEITDKDNNYITSQTYTVSSIGLVYGGDYDIQFTTNEYSQSDIDNNTDNIFNTIDRISIYILYIPKWINYKYQYQFVPENGSLTDNWVLVNDNNAENNVVYNTRVNGKMYARILDMEDNVVYSSDYNITRIGAIKVYDKNTDKLYGAYNRIKEKLNFGGPISDLIVIPVNVVQSIANASNKVCTPYDFGSIAGHRIILPCIEPEHYLGSALWTTIDLIFSGCMFFAISKWFTSAYYKFILLENTPGIKGRRDLD